EAGAQEILQRLRVVAPLVVGGDDGAVRKLIDTGVADVLIDAGIPPVDGAAADLAAARAHAAGAGRVRHGAPGHAALAHDELVLDVPGQAVLGDHAAHAIGRPAIAVDHQVTAILERHQLGLIA